MLTPEELLKRDADIDLETMVKIFRAEYIYILDHKAEEGSYQSTKKYIRDINIDEFTFDFNGKEFIYRPEGKGCEQLEIKEYGKTWWTENNFQYDEDYICY